LVVDGRLVRRPAKDARRKRERFLGRVSRKRVWSSEKWPLSLRCHRITMVQPAESRKGMNLGFSLSANCCRPTCWRVLREPEMRPVLMVQLNNATPIISNREKSVIPGILGAAVLWQFIKRSPRMAGLCLGAGSTKTRKRDIWRSRNGCSIQSSAAACNWRRCPRLVVKHCRI
jgi:hypothetical protein